MGSYPYKDRFPVNRGLPEKGRPRDEILAEMAALAHEEDASWEGGRVSGTMYCGDHDHYDFLNDVFGLYAHVNILQRDITPSATRYEGEVIAMALDLFHADAVTDGEPAGLVTSGGTGSICHAVLAYREVARERGVVQPNFIKPETGHPAFDKACHLFGIELRQAPVDPVTLQADVGWIKDNIDDQTIGFMGSACNYGYGTIDPIEEMSNLAVEKPASRCTSTAASAASSSRSARSSATTSRCSTSACPASPASRPTPTSTATPSRAPRPCCSATSRGGTRSTSSSPTGAAASTRRPAWTAPAPAACSPPPGPRWSSSGARATAATPRRSSRRRSPCRTRCGRTPSCGSWASRRSCSASPATSSTCTTSTTSCGRRAGASTASSTPTPCTWPSPARRPRTASSRRSPTTWPRRSSTPRRRATSPPPPAPSTAASPAA